MQQVMYWQKGTVDICATSLVTGIMVNIIKNGNNETLSIFHVYTSPGPIFHVDSEYEVRNQIWDLCQVLWAGLCWMAVCMVDLHMANFPTVGIPNPTVRVLSFTSKSWGRRVFTTVVHIARMTGAMEITTNCALTSAIF